MREIEMVFAILEVSYTEAFSYNWARSVKQLKYTYTSQMDLNKSTSLIDEVARTEGRKFQKVSLLTKTEFLER